MKNKEQENFVFTGLEEKGRLQYFYHSPSSMLPVRDVLNEQKMGHKTEPHIEIGAENFISCCYQNNNIVPFLKSKEKYLFLFTTCRNPHHKQNGKKSIVGYIVKDEYIYAKKRGGCHTKSELDRYAVKGDIRIFSFVDSFPIEKLGYSKFTRVKKVDCNETERILKQFKGSKNIRKDCINEIEELDKMNKRRDKTCLILRGGNCEWKENCERKIGIELGPVFLIANGGISETNTKRRCT